ATVEVPSPEGGTVAEVLVKAGQKIKVGEAILTLSGATETAASAAAPAKEEGAGRQKAVDETAMAKSAEPAEAAEESADVAGPVVAPKPAANVAVMPARRSFGGRSPADVPAAPSVRQLARELGVDST